MNVPAVAFPLGAITFAAEGNMQSVSVNEYETAVCLAIRLLESSFHELQQGHHPAADRDRHDAYELVRQLSGMLVRAYEEEHGVQDDPPCPDCGQELWGCRCEEPR